MGYQRGVSLTPAQIIAQYRQDQHRQHQAARREAKAAKQATADAALKSNIEAVKAMNILPHPDGAKHRAELDREVAAHNRKRKSTQ